MKLTKAQIKDILARAGKTFVQAFISSISVDAFLGITDLDALKKIGLSMLIAGVAAGISALWNMLQDFLYRKIDQLMPASEDIAKSTEEGFEDVDL